jgi:hypothetical protein
MNRQIVVAVLERAQDDYQLFVEPISGVRILKEQFEPLMVTGDIVVSDALAAGDLRVEILNRTSSLEKIIGQVAVIAAWRKQAPARLVELPS